MTTRVVYLHGFASGPGSRKAQFFRQRIEEECGIPVEVPDLAQGRFEQLTISGQLEVAGRLLDAARPVTLIGSSMGGYLAAILASRHPQVDRVVLLAPAFGFARRWAQSLGQERLAEWKRTGSLAVYHYGDQAERAVGYGLIEDSLRYPDYPDFQQPALILHGRNDTVVPAAISMEFASEHPHARLHLLDSGHELLDVLDRLWAETRAFLLWSSGS